MKTTAEPGMTRRKALLALLGAAPILVFVQQKKDEAVGLDLELPPAATPFSLLDLNLDVKQGFDAEVLFLRVSVNGKEEARVSLREALDILKG